MMKLRKLFTIKVISLLVAITFTVTSTGYGIELSNKSHLRVPSSFQNAEHKRRVNAALISGNIITDSEEEKEDGLLTLNKADALLVSSGKVLVKQEVADNPLRLLRAYNYEKIEALMQIMAEYDRNTYDGLKELILNQRNIKQYYYDLCHDGKEPYYPLSDYLVNDIIAKAFEIHFLAENGLVTQEDYKSKEDQEKEARFYLAIRPIIMANKHNYFTEEFWDIWEREKKIGEALDRGMRFYQVASKRRKKDAISAQEVEMAVAEQLLFKEVAVFMEDIEQPIRVRERSLVPGANVRRCSATLVLQLKSGKEQRVVLAGTVHDEEASSWTYFDINGRRHVSINESVRPTEDEKAFIGHILSVYPEITEILVEQGSLDAEGRLEHWLINLGEEDSPLGTTVREGMELYSDQGELAWITKTALGNDMGVHNIDTRSNVDALLFVYEATNLEEAAYFAFYEAIEQFPDNFVNMHPDLVPRIAYRWFQKANIKISYKEVEALYSRYLEKYSGDIEYKLPNELREEYMASCILHADEDVIVVAHTNHILAIIRQLMPHIISFQPVEVETAKGQLDIWKTKELWAKEGVRTHPTLLPGLLKGSPSVPDAATVGIDIDGEEESSRAIKRESWERLARSLPWVHLCLSVVSCCMALFFDQLVQNDLGIFGQPLFDANQWLTWHASDIFSSYAYASLFYAPWLIRSLVSRERSFKSDIAGVGIAGFVVFIGSTVLEIFVQHDMVDFIVEMPGLILFIILNITQLIFKYGSRMGPELSLSSLFSSRIEHPFLERISEFGPPSEWAQADGITRLSSEVVVLSRDGYHHYLFSDRHRNIVWRKGDGRLEFGYVKDQKFFEYMQQAFEWNDGMLLRTVREMERMHPDTWGGYLAQWGFPSDIEPFTVAGQTISATQQDEGLAPADVSSVNRKAAELSKILSLPGDMKVFPPQGLFGYIVHKPDGTEFEIPSELVKEDESGIIRDVDRRIVEELLEWLESDVFEGTSVYFTVPSTAEYWVEWDSHYEEGSYTVSIFGDSYLVGMGRIVVGRKGLARVFYGLCACSMMRTNDATAVTHITAFGDMYKTLSKQNAVLARISSSPILTFMVESMEKNETWSRIAESWVDEAKRQNRQFSSNRLLINIGEWRIYGVNLQEVDLGSFDNRARTPFEDYLAQNNLSQYKALRELFTPEIIEVLLDDPALRPVFLLVLPDEHLGPIEASDAEAVQEIGGPEILLDHSTFLVGTVDMANQLAEQGYQVIVGVTDRYSKDTMYLGHKVANNRQAYFPLPDGTWLGVKGSGQFGDETKPSHYWLEDEIDPRNRRHMGLAWKKQAESAVDASRVVKGSKGRFVQFLGYRRIYALPDGQGNFVGTEGLKDRFDDELNPVFIFSRIIHPHRLIKLPQLLKADPGLEHLRRRISRTLVRLGYLPSDTVLSPKEMMIMIMQEMGHAEAIKQNRLRFKNTIHSQDFTFAGEEADLDELYTHETYIALIRQGLAMSEDEDMYLLADHKLGIAGIGVKLDILCDMMSHSDAQGQKMSLFPYPLSALRALFGTYFRYLDDRYLQLWAKEFQQGYPHPIIKTTKDVRIDVFHPDSLGFNRQNLALQEEVKGMILSWAQEEMHRRQQNRQTLSDNITLEVKDSLKDQTSVAEARLDEGKLVLHKGTLYTNSITFPLSSIQGAAKNVFYFASLEDTTKQIGSCFLTPGGLVTAWHVYKQIADLLAQNKFLVLIDEEKNWYLLDRAQLLLSRPTKELGDIAILSTPSDLTDHPGLELGSDPDVGDVVFALAYPDRPQLLKTDPVWNKVLTVSVGHVLKDSLGRLHVDTEAWFGSSGGVLLNDRGQAIAVITGPFTFAGVTEKAVAYKLSAQKLDLNQLSREPIDLTGPGKTVVQETPATEQITSEHSVVRLSGSGQTGAAVARVAVTRKQPFSSYKEVIVRGASTIGTTEQEKGDFLQWVSLQDPNKAVVIIAMNREEYDRIKEFDEYVHIRVVYREGDDEFLLEEEVEDYQIITLDDKHWWALCDVLNIYVNGIDLERYIDTLRPIEKEALLQV